MCILLKTGSFNAYITPPIVYITPPANSHANAVKDIEANSGLNANKQSQPIKIYIVEFSHFGELTQNAVSINPHTARLHISTRSGMPDCLGSASRHTGV